MTPDELQAVAARLEAAHLDVRQLVAEVARLQGQTVQLMQRALDAEVEVQNLTKAWRHTADERDQWRLRWTRAQEQVSRWFGLALDGWRTSKASNG